MLHHDEAPGHLDGRSHGALGREKRAGNDVMAVAYGMGSFLFFAFGWIPLIDLFFIWRQKETGMAIGLPARDMLVTRQDQSPKKVFHLFSLLLSGFLDIEAQIKRMFKSV